MRSVIPDIAWTCIGSTIDLTDLCKAYAQANEHDFDSSSDVSCRVVVEVLPSMPAYLRDRVTHVSFPKELLIAVDDNDEYLQDLCIWMTEHLMMKVVTLAMPDDEIFGNSEEESVDWDSRLHSQFAFLLARGDVGGLRLAYPKRYDKHNLDPLELSLIEDWVADGLMQNYSFEYNATVKAVCSNAPEQMAGPDEGRTMLLMMTRAILWVTLADAGFRMEFETEARIEMGTVVAISRDGMWKSVNLAQSMVKEMVFWWWSHCAVCIAHGRSGDDVRHKSSDCSIGSSIRLRQQRLMERSGAGECCCPVCFDAAERGMSLRRCGLMLQIRKIILILRLSPAGSMQRLIGHAVARRGIQGIDENEQTMQWLLKPRKMIGTPEFPTKSALSDVACTFVTLTNAAQRYLSVAERGKIQESTR